MARLLFPVAALKSLCNLTVCNPQMPLVHTRTISFFKCQKKPVEDPFIIVRANRDDADEIVDLMWDGFHPDEPTTNSLGLGFGRNCVFDDMARKYLSQGLSIVARCKYNGCIVGASINSVSCPWDPDLLEEFACTLKCKNMTKLYMFQAYIQRTPRLWDKYCQQHIFELKHVFVRPCDRRKGLCKRLVATSRDLAADAGFRVIRVDATNIFASRVCQKLKMIKVYTLPYCSYVNDENEPVMKIAQPNKGVEVYVDLPHAVDFRKK